MLTPTYPIDQIGVQERVARLATRSIKKESKGHALTLALSMIDLTTLEGRDSPGKVRQLCYKATHLHERFPGLPHVAAVCEITSTRRFGPLPPLAGACSRR